MPKHICGWEGVAKSIERKQLEGDASGQRSSILVKADLPRTESQSRSKKKAGPEAC